MNALVLASQLTTRDIMHESLFISSQIQLTLFSYGIVSISVASASTQDQELKSVPLYYG